MAALIIALLFSASVFAELRKGEKLHPFSLKSVDDRIVTAEIDEDRLTVITEFTKDGKKVVKKHEPDAVLLDFWAIQCPPCRAAIPRLEELHKKYRRKKEEDKGGLLVIGIGLDSGGAKVIKPFARKSKVTYVMLADSTEKPDKEKPGEDDKLLRTAHEAAGRYKVRFIPTMYLLDARGVIKDVHVGFRPGLEVEIENEIKKLMAERQE
jgi:thiol-disulfide isomerase/thioredoxin